MSRGRFWSITLFWWIIALLIFLGIDLANYPWTASFVQKIGYAVIEITASFLIGMLFSIIQNRW